ncbi:MAG: threonine/serine exporter family protein, partial [Bacteroidales bacterium]|nr:threonine/serine exporter family protein [Bacteroidales bacterium]
MNIEQSNNNQHEYLKQFCVMITEYASVMLESGAISSAIENCVHRIADAFHIKCDVSILPKRVLIALWSEDQEHSYNNVGRTIKHGINLNTVIRLTNLSYSPEKESMSIESMNSQIAAIKSSPRINPYIVLALTAVANASFCRLFGGDIIAMLIVLTATLCGFFLKQKMLAAKWDGRIVTLLSALVAATMGTSGVVFGWSDTPDVAIASSVLFLVPGIPFINSMGDMLSGHHLCAVSRLLEAVITTACLSL